MFNVYGDRQRVEQFCRALDYEHPMGLQFINLPELHAHIMKIGEETLLSHYLTENERQIYKKFSSHKRKVEWLCGRLAAKNAFLEIVGIGGPKDANFNQQVDILADGSGRPYIQCKAINDLVNYDVSISHSSEMACALVVKRGLCGLDIQKVTPRVAKVQERFCSPEESDVLQRFETFSGKRINDLERLSVLWAAKEALRKSCSTKGLPGFLEMKLSGMQESIENNMACIVMTLSYIGDEPAIKILAGSCKVAAVLFDGFGLAVNVHPEG